MKTRFVCNACEHEQAKWMGRCPSCGQYNSLEEVLVKPATRTAKGAKSAASVGASPKPLSQISVAAELGLDPRTHGQLGLFLRFCKRLARARLGA